MMWCRKWLERAKELEDAERQDALSRPAHVRSTTKGKRLLLTEEILKSRAYSEKDRLWPAISLRVHSRSWQVAQGNSGTGH